MSGMNKITKIRDTQPNILEDVEDPKHRLDVAAYKVVEEFSKRDPVLAAVFSNVKAPLADFLNEFLGPEPPAQERSRPRKRNTARSKRVARERRTA